MTINSLLKKWKGKVIDDYGGVTSPSYNEFERNYKSCIKDFCKSINFELYKFNGNHYEFSCVLKSNETGRFYYMSISDVRYWRDEWNEHILYRTMQHEKDWTGGSNRYAGLLELPHYLLRLDEKEDRL